MDPRADVLVLMLGDQPGVTADTVAALLAGRGDAPLAVCRYDDGRGHPLAFSRGMFEALSNLHGDKGVWKLLDRRADDVVDVPVAGPIPERRRHLGGLRSGALRHERGTGRRLRTGSPRGDRVAVATVVDAKKSAPQPPGTKMGINELGEVVGAVSGGCVEGAVVEVAERIIDGARTAAPALRDRRRRRLGRRAAVRRRDQRLGAELRRRRGAGSLHRAARRAAHGRRS